jgi:uncharacterized phage protein gp47/JayE
MADYGLLTTGFVPKPTTVIRDEINAEVQGEFGASIDVSDGSLLGFLIGIVAETFGKLWELSEAVNSSQDPDKATGAALDGLCALTGTFREPPRPSTVTLTLTGTPTTVVGVGSRASVESTGAEFETTASGTIALLASWAALTAYVVGDRVTNASRCYECITAGSSDISGGPTTTAEDITDSTVHWRYLGEGTGACDVAAECTETGATVAVAGDISEIETPVGGWQSVKNLLDADPGNDLGSDEATRLQRGIDLAAAGTSTADAIRQALLAVDDVTAATVFVNDTDVTDADGVPPHSVECLVEGGDDQDIIDCLFANVAAGIHTHSSGSGAVTGTATDSQGNEHDVEFSRPEEVNIWVIVNVIVSNVAGEFPSDGAAQIEEAIVDFGDAQSTGKNAVASSTGAQSFKVDGVIDVTSTLIGTANPPVASTTIAISSRQKAKFDTSRITVNTTPGTP